MKRKRILIVGLGALALLGAWRVGVYAQTLGETAAAAGAGATLGAAGGSGLLTPSQYAAPATGAAANRGAMMDEGGNAGGAAGGAGGGAGAAAGGGATVTVRTTAPPPRWGPDSGSDMVRQLTSTRTRTTRAAAPAPRRTSASAARVARMTRAQRSRAVHSKYQKPPVGYLAWYLPEDRYKVTSKVWQFVTTPNDRFYYHPWAPAMRLREPSRVIGFHTWQDAMIAGYRPDPATKPTPGRQLAELATLTRGPMLASYFEYVYAGQVTPAAFDANYRYTRHVANLVRSQSHTRHLVGPTVNQVLGAALGLNALPTEVGGTPRPRQVEGGGPAPMPIAAGGPPAGGLGDTTDRREGEYNTFRNNAGGLAARP